MVWYAKQPSNAAIVRPEVKKNPQGILSVSRSFLPGRVLYFRHWLGGRVAPALEGTLVSIFTGATPSLPMPICLAACFDKSMSRPLAYGPRSVISTLYENGETKDCGLLCSLTNIRKYFMRLEIGCKRKTVLMPRQKYRRMYGTN